jgi:predicted transcriptional regulator
MFHLVARPKPCRIMMLLRDTEGAWHLSKLAKSSDTSYVYVTHLVSKLEAGGLVLVESKGKKRVVKLTEKGLAVANIIHELMGKLQS